jgi:hypothetical protein
MRWIALLLAACAAYSISAAQAHAEVVGTTPISGPTTAAISLDGGAAAVAATSQTHVILASRAGGAWREQDVSGTTAFVRDAQVAVNANGTLVAAWAQYTRARGDELVIAAGRAGAPVQIVARRAVARASSASPRLATLNDRRILLVWRDGTRVRAAPVLGDRLGPAHVVASRAGTIALAALRSRAVLAWLDRYSGHATRTLRSVQLRGDGTLLTRPLVVSHAASSSIRVAGNTEPRAIVSWLRLGGPAQAFRREAFTRQVAPYTRPARPVAAGTIPLDAPAIDLADDASAALTLRASAPGLPSFGIVAANSQSGGVWTRVAPLAQGSPMNGSPQAVALGDRRALAIWADARAAPGTPVYDVHVVARDGVGNVTASQVLATPYDHIDGKGVGVAHAGSRTLIAYGAPGGGFAISERSG